MVPIVETKEEVFLKTMIPKTHPKSTAKFRLQSFIKENSKTGFKEVIMKTLVLGASGATGKLVVAQLLDQNIPAKILIRESATIPDKFIKNENIEIIKGNVHGFSLEEIQELITDCDSIVCCLGHNISFKGLFGKPRRLVADTVEKITAAIQASNSPKKFILMSTTAYTNKYQGETNTLLEKLVFKLLEFILPPHKDNILATNHLIYKLGNSKMVEWVALRPDSLIDEDTKSEYKLFESKIRSPLHNAGKTSRINVAHFMVDLASNKGSWEKWKHKTPVIYNEQWATVSS